MTGGNSKLVANGGGANSKLPLLFPRKGEKQQQKLTVDSFLRMKWYTLRVLLLSEFVLLGSAGNMVYMIYAGAAPKTVSCVGTNTTITDVCKNHPIDWRNQDCEIDPHYEFRSINVEFDHLCGETTLVKSSISIQMAGVLIGAIFWGHISDSQGRKAALVPCFTIMSLLSLACSYSWDLVSFTIIRTLLAFFNGGAVSIYAVYKTEHLPHKHRFLIASIIAWSPNFILLNGIAYLTGEWRLFQRVLFAISAPAFFFFFTVSESPRFLIQRGKLAEARAVMARMQEVDGVSDVKKDAMNRMIDGEHERLAQRERKARRYNIFALFRFRELAIPTVVFCFGILGTSMISFGILFFLDSLSGSLFLNSVYLGLLRWTINIASGLADFKLSWMTRRVLHTSTLMMAASMLMTIATLHFMGLADQFSEAIRIFTLVAAACCSQVFITKGMTAMEFYPTPIRNSAMSFKSTFSRAGNVLAPQLFLYLPTPWLYTFLCTVAVLDCLGFLLAIPETKGRPLPEKLPDEKEEEERREREKVGKLKLVKGLSV